MCSLEWLELRFHLNGRNTSRANSIPANFDSNTFQCHSKTVKQPRRRPSLLKASFFVKHTR